MRMLGASVPFAFAFSVQAALLGPSTRTVKVRVRRAPHVVESPFLAPAALPPTHPPTHPPTPTHPLLWFLPRIPDASVRRDEVLVVRVLAHVAQGAARTLDKVGAGEMRRHALEDKRDAPLSPDDLLDEAVVERETPEQITHRFLFRSKRGNTAGVSFPPVCFVLG